MSAKTVPAIYVDHLIKTFGTVEAVRDISLRVEHGEIFAFLGPNGAGKSTTIKILTTLLKPTSGIVQLNGDDVTHNQDKARRNFGIVFQDPSVDVELTAYENMSLHASLYSIPQKEASQRIEELLKMMELWDRRDSYVKTFSGGMKRRLEIARGLLHKPKILFLDEPTLGLDTQTRNLLWTYVKKLSETEDMTIFFTTHYLEEAALVAERIAIIDHGQIVALGTDKQLQEQTKTTSLEEAYLALTGSTIRDEPVDPKAEQMRNRARLRQ